MGVGDKKSELVETDIVDTAGHIAILPVANVASQNDCDCCAV